MKLIILLCAVAAALASPIERDEFDIETVLLEDLVAPLAGRDQTSIVGNCQPSDRLLYAETVNVKAATLQVKKKDITYPPDHSNQGGFITCIKIMDQLRTGKNASFKVSSGGVNQRFAIINMKSQRGEPINYVVQIYGR